MKRILKMTLGVSVCAGLASAQLDPAGLNQEASEYFSEGQEKLESMLNLPDTNKAAKNVILFVSDGAGPAIVTATRIFDGQEKGMMGEENDLPFEKFPYAAVTKTYNTNAQTPDSAGTSTAMLTGAKTKQGVLSVAQDVLRGDCAGTQGAELMTATMMAEMAGMSTGVISTARITHATPAAGYAHSADRNWEADGDLPEEAVTAGCSDIARQLIEFPYGDGFDLALGGGRRSFIGENMTDPEDEEAVGSRTDGRDLTAEWVEAGGAYVFDQAGFAALDAASEAPVLGLFNGSHMEYEYDRINEHAAIDAADEPSLAEMVDFAIDKLSTNENGYFLHVEGGRVDHAAHAGNAYRMLTDNVAFANAVQTALEKVDLEDTLIIVTADHAHTLTLAGYAQRGNPILGLVRGLDDQGNPLDELALAADEKPYTSLAFINGPGAADIIGQEERPAPIEEEVLEPDYLQQALIPMASETHGGTDIITYATGPMSHLMGGTVEQSYVFHVIDHALDLREAAQEGGVTREVTVPEPIVATDTTDADTTDADAMDMDMDTEAADMTDTEMTDTDAAADTETPATQPQGSDTVTDPSVEETVAALNGSITNVEVAAGLELTQGWISQLSTLDDPDLEPIIQDLQALQDALSADPVDSAEVKTLLTNLGEATTAAAENATFDQERLTQLGQVLVRAADGL